METIKIGLDAGHGLNTPGKQTPDGIKEWTLNDKVRDKVMYILKDYNVEFVNVDGDEGNTDEMLSTRRNAYLSAGVKAFVSIHHNAYTSNWNEATGVEVYTDKNYTEQDNMLANLIYKNLVAYTGLRGRGVKRANFSVINQNSIPAVLCEGGFMDGTNDYKVITSEHGQNMYAKAVAEGLIEFLGLEKKSEEVDKPTASVNTTAPVTTPTSTTTTNTTTKASDVKMTTIRKGSKGKAVKVWQAIVGVTVDGDFGSKTEAATLEFQKKTFPNNSGEWDGVVGNKTWKAGLESV